MKKLSCVLMLLGAMLCGSANLCSAAKGYHQKNIETQQRAQIRAQQKARRREKPKKCQVPGRKKDHSGNHSS